MLSVLCIRRTFANIIKNQCKHQTQRFQSTKNNNILKLISKPDRASSIALIDEYGPITFSELDLLSTKLANIISSNHLPKQNQPIASFNESNRNYVISMLATWKVGRYFLPLCPDYPEHELNYFIEDSETGLLLYSTPSTIRGTNNTVDNKVVTSKSTTSELVSKLKTFSFNIDDISTHQYDVIASLTQPQRLHSSLSFIPQESDKMGLILYTSGTTGRPKGVLHDESNITYMIKSLVESWQYSNQDKILHFLPLHHLHGVLNKLLCMLWVGGTIEFLPNAKPISIWKRLSQEYHHQQQQLKDPKFQSFKPLSLFMGVPTIYAKMVEEIKLYAEHHHLTLFDNFKDIVNINHESHSFTGGESVDSCGSNDNNTTVTSNSSKSTLSTDSKQQTSNSSKSTLSTDSKQQLTLQDIQQGLQILFSMRLHVCGSAALPEPLFNQWQKLTKQVLLERYGMTELGMVLSNPCITTDGDKSRSGDDSNSTSANISSSCSDVNTNSHIGKRKVGTVGKPLPYIECKLVDDNECDITTIDSPGELRVKAKTVFKEYINKPEETARSFDKNGYFKTGDIAAVDSDGYYRILGRSSMDIIKSGGYKLSSLEIEREILSHPSVVETAVFGTPDDVLGEKVVAIIVWRQKSSTTTSSPTTDTEGTQETEIRSFLKQRLASYKQPRIYKFVENIPRNHIGKVNKKSLKRIFVLVKD